MRNILTGLALAIATVASADVPAPLQGYAYGDVAAPDGSEWENCEALSLNKEQPRAYFFSFRNVESARKVLPEFSDYYKSLDGTWKFRWVNTPDKRVADFYTAGFADAAWDNIAVPGCWNVQGIRKDGTRKYGTPIYCNQPVPFMHTVAVDDWRGGVMRTPPEDWTAYTDRNEVGQYRRTFTLPEGWDGREVYLNFDGVDSFFYLWVNGKYVGFSKNSRNTATFDITSKLNRKGENTLAVEVYRFSDGSFLESQDMFRLPGIIRSVYLTSTPQLRIGDMAVRTTIERNTFGQVTGNVNVLATVRNLSAKSAKGMSIRYEVFPVELYSDATGDESVVAPVTSATFALDKGGADQVTTDFVMTQPRLWSAEQPYRYVLVAQLCDAKGRTIETVSTYFGVRQVEIRHTEGEEDEFGLTGRYFYVNNRPIKLKGVNRHENNLVTGHSITRQQMEDEIMLMKRANINHVRNCHYNDDPYWYIACDKYGIYLEDEANIESHEYYYGKASLSHPLEWRPAHVARNMEMVHAHVNHPSIVIWSLGNEAGPGDNFVAAYDAIKAFDKSRPVQYERNNNIVDMGSNQYPSIPWVQEAVKGHMNIKYPFHISEYAHSMGNALGNFVDYWNAMESTNFFCGGAIWDWVDQALWNYTPEGEAYMAYGGDFGDKPNSGMFCMNGILFPDFTPKPQYAEVKRVHQNVGVKMRDVAAGKVEVFNKNYFTTLDDLVPRVIVTRNGEEVERYDNVIRPRRPVGSREMQVWTLPYDYSKYAADDEGEYYVTLQFLLAADKPWAEAGYVQAEVQLPLKKASAFEALMAQGDAPVLVVTPQEDIVSGDGWNVAFDNATGTISSLSYAGKDIITPGNGPRLSALRAPTDNDIWTFRNWFANGLHDLRHHVTGHKTYRREDGAVVLQYTVESQGLTGAKILGGGLSGQYELTEERPLGPDDMKFVTNQIWTVFPDGSIELQAAIDSNDPAVVLPRLGYEITLPSELSDYTYYGRGPINNFNDRETSQQVGRYKSTVAEQYVPFPKPQSMGNREDVRWNALTGENGAGVMFVATDGTMSASALPWTDLELTFAPHPYQLPESKGTTLHLDHKVLGLGGASCGQGGPLTPDRVFGSPQTFGFIMRPVAEGDDMQQRAQVASAGDHPVLVSRDRLGNVTLASADPSAVLKYRILSNGTTAPTKARKGKRQPVAATYTVPFDMREGGVVEVWDEAVPQLVSTVEFPRIESVPVTVMFASAQEPGYEATALVDGDPNTYWHTTYGVTMALFPHWVDFDCGEPRNIKGFTILPRSGNTYGDVKDWKIELSEDAANWTQVVTGTFDGGKKEKRVMFDKPHRARYLRFTALNSQSGQDYAAAAEFGILAE